MPEAPFPLFHDLREGVRQSGRHAEKPVPHAFGVAEEPPRHDGRGSATVRKSLSGDAKRALP